MKKILYVLIAVAMIAAVAPAAAQAQATRTWVSGVGSDVNPCSRTAPCQTFAGAISKTATGGEINALDSAGYGAVTITKSITIDGSGYHSSILHSATNGVIVNAPADADVVLRGLSINGAGISAAPGCPNISGVRAVWLRNARSLTIENTRIAGNTTAGLHLAPETSDAKVVVNNADIGKGCQNGIDAAPAPDRKLDVMVRDSTISNTSTAVRAAVGAHVWLTGSTIFGNGTGLLPTGGGLIDSAGENQVFGNGVDGAFSNAPVPAPPTPAPTPPATKAAPVTVKKCKVPKLAGLTLTTARKRLKAANCALGKVTLKTTRKRKQSGRITAQRTKVGVQLAAGAKVPVTVWRLAKG
jgi:hypothetical protein